MKMSDLTPISAPKLFLVGEGSSFSFEMNA